MKTLLENTLKLLPVIVMVGISYILFEEKDGSLDEGTKLSLSALLGAMASYLFVQYSEFMKKIDESKRRHGKSLHSLDVKLNMQLSWLADVIFHLDNHISIVQRVLGGEPNIVFDASSYRDPLKIDAEIFDVNNLPLKNKLLSVKTTYDKLENDISSMQEGQKFSIDAVASKNMPIGDYVASLPSHLENAQTIKAFSEKAVESTKDTIAAVRVLTNDSRSLTNSVRRFFIEHTNPGNFDELKSTERENLDNQIIAVKNDSRNEIRDVEKELNK